MIRDKADNSLPDEMALLLIHAATKSDGCPIPFPIISRPQAGDRKQRTPAELDKAAEGLLRRGYLSRRVTTNRKQVWRNVRGVGDCTLEITELGRAAIRW
jgi:hypothetical protein